MSPSRTMLPQVRWIWLVIPPYYAVVSGITLLAYWRDKRAASRGGWRISERRLHVLALVGGWPGAIAGMRVFRHKTRRTIFKAVVTIAAIVHIGWWLLYWTLLK